MLSHPSSSHFAEAQDELFYRCLVLQISNAHSRIIHRCYCLAISRIQKGRRRSLEAIATSVYQSGRLPSHTLEEVNKSAESILDAGSRYDSYKTELGHGTIFALGDKVAESLSVRV
jgi:hypothetical protein